MTHRTEFINGLHALADYLDTNPALPVPAFHTEVLIHIRGTDSEQRAEVDRLAALLGVSTVDRTDTGGHYTATRAFGPVEYRCVAVPSAVRAAFNAGMSYANSVIPDDEAA
ncbi:hypothetical protein [Actinoallomurus sp. CA-142502]|uniref:hypothetical protein n=1 Tax=Actinoallomurus sp. CA-142502 TaxID=3239885 RepID=UPI003D944AD8